MGNLSIPVNNSLPSCFFRETTYIPPAPNNSIGTYLIVYVIVQENAIWIVFSKTKQKTVIILLLFFSTHTQISTIMVDKHYTLASAPSF